MSRLHHVVLLFQQAYRNCGAPDHSDGLPISPTYGWPITQEFVKSIHTSRLALRLVDTNPATSSKLLMASVRERQYALNGSRALVVESTLSPCREKVDCRHCP